MTKLKEEARVRRRWLSDSFNRCAQSIEEAAASARSMVKAMEQTGVLLRAPPERPFVENSKENDMLTWDNFEFIESEATLPWFPLDWIMVDEHLDYCLQRVDAFYLRLLNVITHDAVVCNRYYVPKKTVEVAEKVWENPCKNNNHPVVTGVVHGKPLNFRASEDVVVKIDTKKPSTCSGQYEIYKGHFWYQVKDGTLMCELSCLISDKTDQAKLGRI